jgi:hypothetical protein
MTWTVTFFPFTLAAIGTFSVTGTADSGYPESRLYDRAISLFWKDTVTEAKEFKTDQGAGGLSIDSLFIEKHNFDGLAMAWQYSSDDFSADVNDAVTGWTQSGNGQIVKTLGTPITAQYWRVTLGSITDPVCSEIYLSLGYSFNCLRQQNPSGLDMSNVRWNKGLGGVERSTKFGPARKARVYTFWLDPTEWAELEAVISYLDDYAAPFYVQDHEGAYYLARFEEDPHFDFNHNTHTRVDVRIIEQL